MRSALLLSVLVTACGARTGTLDQEPLDRDAGMDDGGRPRDAGMDAGRDGGPDSGLDAGPDAGRDGGCPPVDDGCSDTEQCNSGSDDDCDGEVDEGCPCSPGSVQACFSGPPGRRNVGACQDGSQVCNATGAWGDCEGGILPNADVCTGRDDLCNGCSDQRICPIDCPSPGDPRVPDGQPFEPYELRGREFYRGASARSWMWRVEGGPCDDLAPRLESFTLDGANTENATFTPRLSGDYRVTLSVTVPTGVLECSWLVHVEGPGLRVEMCYPESETQDLDLFLHNPANMMEWYIRGGTAFEPIPEAACGWANCEAMIRLTSHPITGRPVTRADWGYMPSPLENCENGPQGDQWRALGFCANPRLDIDNNLSEGTGLPENINVDMPGEGQRFRIMVQNYSGDRAEPLVNVYCGGRRVATFGQAPDIVRRFMGRRGDESMGAMWRVADVTTHIDAAGETTCDVQQVHPPGTTSGYDITFDNPRY
jgi:hypothetical protein